LSSWPDDLDEVPRVVERVSGGHTVRAYPALVESGTAVDLRVFATEAAQAAAMGPGVRRLLRLSVPSPVKAVERALDPRTRLVLGRRLVRLPHGIAADRERMLRVHAVEAAYDDLGFDVPDIARLIEELRVSLWAQQLGTSRPVSEQRIHKAIDAARKT